MNRVPKILHYIFGMPGRGAKPWSLTHHVCVASGISRIQPDQTFFYYEEEPSGDWWALTKPLVTEVKVQAPREIFGNPLVHVAHKADVLRLQKLIELGGIYLDVDVLVHRDFDDLLDCSLAMGREVARGKSGLTNAVIIAEPRAPFLERWLDCYRTFRSRGRDRYWSEHSVELPLKLASQYPEEITLLGPKAFYWPLWTKDHIEWIFNSRQEITSSPDVYANHLWESTAWQYLAGLTPGEVRRWETNFHHWVKPYVADVGDDYGASNYGARYKAWRTIKRLLRDPRNRRPVDASQVS